MVDFTVPLVLLFEPLHMLHLIVVRAAELLGPPVAGERRTLIARIVAGTSHSWDKSTSTCLSFPAISSLAGDSSAAFLTSSKGSKGVRHQIN
jgi:hypothetical protein